MATAEFKMCEARAFWCVSSELRQALRDHAPRHEIDTLTTELENHARYGVQPKVRQGADILLTQAQRIVRHG